MTSQSARQRRPAEAPETPAAGAAVNAAGPDPAKAYLVYDGECPVCSAYVRVVRFREAAGEIELLNARDGGPVVDRVVEAGLDLDEGMVLWYGGRFYHGADCIHMLAMLSSSSGLANRINAAVFRSPTLARRLYPVLRFGRNTLLKLLGRSPLDLSAG